MNDPQELPCPGCKELVSEYSWCEACGVCASCCSCRPVELGQARGLWWDDSDMEDETYFWDRGS